MGERASGDAVEEALAELTAIVADQQRRLDEQAERIAELSGALERSGAAATHPPAIEAIEAGSRSSASLDRRSLLRTATAAATGALVAGAATAFGQANPAAAAEQTEALGIVLPDANDIAIYARTTADPVDRFAVRADGTVIWLAPELETDFVLYRVPVAGGPSLQAVVDDMAVFNGVANPVHYLGWNVDGHGGRIDATRGAAWLQLEADYYADAVGQGVEHTTEIHLQLTGDRAQAKTVRAFTTAFGGTSEKLATTVAGDFFRIVDSADEPVLNFDTAGDVFLHRQLVVESRGGGLILDANVADPDNGSPQLTLRAAPADSALASILWQRASTDVWRLSLVGSALDLIDVARVRTQASFQLGDPGTARTVIADELVIRRGSDVQTADLLRLVDEDDEPIVAVDATGVLRLGSSEVSLQAGAGEPDAAVAAPVGSLFMRTDGVKGATLYVKEAGDDDTGWVAAGATAAGGFVPLTQPTRVYDSRPGYEPTVGEQSVLPADTARPVDLTANASGVPTWASAVMVSLVATQTLSSSRGWLAIYANGLKFPGTSSVNWSSAGRSAATTTVTAIDAEGRCAIYGGSECDVVIDVIGYFL